MKQQVDRIWRVVATGLSFAVFGLGALLLAISWLPLLRLTSGSAARARARIQRSVSAAMRAFVWMMRRLGLLTYEVQGLQRLQRPGQLIIANHPSLIDVVYLIGFVPEVDCIVKAGLWRNPFLRGPVSWAGYIPNRSPERLVEDAAASLRAGRSLIIFPEGTRSVPGMPLQMKRGAAQIAIAADADVIPVTIRCEPLTLTKGAPWYRVPDRRPHWTLDVGHPFRVADVLELTLPAPVAARQLTRVFRQYFECRAVAPALAEDRPMPTPVFERKPVDESGAVSVGSVSR